MKPTVDKATGRWIRAILGDLLETRKENRFTEQEAAEILMEVLQIRTFLDELEFVARKDLEYHLSKPKLTLVKDE